jgi:hypothetical protein
LLLFAPCAYGVLQRYSSVAGMSMLVSRMHRIILYIA